MSFKVGSRVGKPEISIRHNHRVNCGRGGRGDGVRTRVGVASTLLYRLSYATIREVRRVAARW